MSNIHRKNNDLIKDDMNSCHTSRDPKHFWATSKSLDDRTTNTPWFHWQSIFYPCNNKSTMLMNGLYTKKLEWPDWNKDKEIYNLGMEVGPTFQVANQVKSWSPHPLKHKDEIVLEETVQQPLSFLQPYQLWHLVWKGKYIYDMDKIQKKIHFFMNYTYNKGKNIIIQRSFWFTISCRHEKVYLSIAKLEVMKRTK